MRRDDEGPAIGETPCLPQPPSDRGTPRIPRGLIGSRASRSVLLFATALLIGASPEKRNDEIRLVNPYAPDSLPSTVQVRLLGHTGETLEKTTAAVRDGLVGVPHVSGAERIAVAADLYEETVTPLSVATESGVVLLPYGRLAVELRSHEPLPPSEFVRLWLRRASDGTLLRFHREIGPSDSFDIRVPGGEWDAVARRSGREPVASHVAVAPGSAARLSFPEADNGLLVRLTVRDSEGGRPVSEASLRWSMSASPTLGQIVRGTGETALEPLISLALNEAGTKTDPFGQAEIAHLPAIPHFWTISRAGYRVEHVNVDVSPNAREKRVAVTLRPSPDLIVRVEDLGKTPVPLQVSVLARPSGDSRAPFKLFWKGAVGADSPKRFEHLPDAEYRFDLLDESGVLQHRAWLPAEDRAWEQRSITVKLTREPRTVTGRITRGDEPIPGVLFFGAVGSHGLPEDDLVVPESLLGERAARSGPDGYYRLELGGPGIYKVSYGSPERGFSGTAGPVDLSATTFATLDIALPRGQLSVQVISAKDQQPIPEAVLGITLWKSPSRPGSSYETKADAEGRYLEAGLAAEKASLKVSAPGFETKRVDLGIKDPDVEDSTLIVELKPVSALRFRVTDERGLPLPGTELWTLEEQGPGDLEPGLARVAQTDASGLAILENPDTDLRPYVFLAKGYRLEVSPAAGSSDGQEIQVPLMPVEVTYALRIRRASGEPAGETALAFRRFGTTYPWALLGMKVRQEGRDYQATLASLADGRISIHELLGPGEYDVLLFAPADFQTRQRHLYKALGRISLPLQADTTLTIPVR